MYALNGDSVVDIYQGVRAYSIMCLTAQFVLESLDNKVD